MTDHKPTEAGFTRVKILRKYDIFDLACISLFNAVVFGSGLGVGWLIWCY
tara:strand:- start:382 stop:531 length:150 start_codon:yes stop_codon:yes gene_type:complete